MVGGHILLDGVYLSLLFDYGKGRGLLCRLIYSFALFLNQRYTIFHNTKTTGLTMYLLGLMNDQGSQLAALLAAMSYIMIIVGLLVIILTQSGKLLPKYGRYSFASRSFPVPGRLAWFVQELPAFAWMAYYILCSDNMNIAEQPVNIILMLLFTIHYFQR